MTTVLLLNGAVLAALLALMIREEIRFRSFKKTVAAAKEELTSVAYQLRTPLGNLSKYSSLLQSKEFGILTLSQQEALSNMQASLGESLIVLDRLLARSHLEEEKVSMQRSRLNLSAIIQGALIALHPVAEKMEHSVVVKGDRDVMLTSDPILLHGIFDELLANALYYTPEGGKVTVTVSEQRGKILVEIQDTGIGITAAEKKRLFEKFFRGERAKTMHAGNGLGLTFAKQFCEELGATLAYRPGRQKGSIFAVYLPK